MLLQSQKFTCNLLNQVKWLGLKEKKRKLPKGIFQSGNFPAVQFPKRQLPKSVLTVALGHHSVFTAALGPLAAALDPTL